MLKRIFSKISRLGQLVALGEIISLKDVFILRNMERYRPGQVKSKMGLIEYVDATSLLSGLKEIFVDEIYRVKPGIKQSLVVIDCGANIGLSAIYFSETCKARVYAYEADPAISGVLQRNVANNCREGAVEVKNEAVWIDENGVRFDVEGAYSGQIQKHGHDLVKNSVSVPSVRLRSLITDTEGVNFLKLDIEGAENEALLDCADVLNKLDYIFIEWHSITQDSQFLGEILNLLKKEGFRYHVHEAFTSSHPFVQVDEMCGMDLQLNVFASKIDVS